VSGDTIGPKLARLERVYAFDGLRATMLSCVVLYHSVVSYLTVPTAIWPFKDRVTTAMADLVVRFFDVFQMQIFFILAGFFGAMLYLSCGPRAFARNRALRIALPFAVAWLTLHPVVAAGFVFARTAQASGSLVAGLDAVGAAVLDGSLFLQNSTMHLWFLYDLLFFYAAMLVLAPLFARIPAAWRDAAMALFGSMIGRPWLRLPLLALVTFVIVRFMSGPLFASVSFVPNGRLLIGYGLYFGFGWLLYFSRERIAGFERFAWTHVLLGLTIFFMTMPLLGLMAGGPLTRPAFQLASAASGATVVWLLFFGLTGLFIRHVDRPSPAIRYLVDASFWIYLVHLPFTIWLPGLLAGFALAPWIKILSVLAVTYVVALATYDLFVRSTAMGAVLSGQRYPRALFAATGPAPA
jgi:peptidoglycan/LPS O-acetylase OafA/YrhL